VKIIHLVRLRNTPIFKQLQYEEALIRADKRNWCLLNDGSTEAIVMGISGKPEELIDERHLSTPIIRRFSGGGTVLIDPNTCFVTLVCNHRDVAASPFPQHILNWKGDLLGYEVKENDYVLNGKKFGGNAQYITKSRWLHHTSLLWDFDLEKMNVLKLPPKMPIYRERREHGEFLCRLKDIYTNKEELFEKIVQALSTQFIVKEVSEEECVACLNLPHRKSTRYEKICRMGPLTS